MKKQTYLEPAVQVLSLGTMQETLQTPSISILAVAGTNLSDPYVMTSDEFDTIF